MEKLDELKKILKQIVNIQEKAELAFAARSRAESGRPALDVDSDQELVKGYNAIRTQIDALR